MDFAEDLASWLVECGLTAQLEQEEGGMQHRMFVVRLEASISSLAPRHPRLAQSLLEVPAGVLATTRGMLEEAKLLAPSSRLWIRLQGLQPHQSVSEAVAHIRAQAHCLVSCTGVVAGLTAPFPQRYSSTFVCSLCGAERSYTSGDAAPSMCCGRAVVEDASRQVVVPTRFALIGETSTAAGWQGACILGNRHLVVKMQDDLGEACRLGDRVAMTGFGSHCSGVPPALVPAGTLPLLCEVGMEAMHVARLGIAPALSPEVSSTLAPAAMQRAQAMPGTTLGPLLAAMHDWLRPPCSLMAQVALLLSACSAGVPLISEPRQVTDLCPDAMVISAPAHTSHAHLHLLLFSPGHDPALHRTLASTAAGLCRQSVIAGHDSKMLLPHLHAGATPFPSVPLQMVFAGQLCEAAAGVCVLPAAALPGGKRAKALAEALRSGRVEVQAGSGVVAADVTTSVWCLCNHQEDLVKAGGDPSWAPPTARFAAKHGPALLAQFDIILTCGDSTPAQQDSWAAEFLMEAVQADSSAPVGREQAREEARAALQSHVSAAQALPLPQMTADAMGLLHWYWGTLRAAGEEAAGSTALQTLARLACACARMFHRPVVLPHPDAVLAVALHEERMLGLGAEGGLWAPWREQVLAGADLDACLQALCKGIYSAARGSSFAPWQGTEHEE